MKNKKIIGRHIPFSIMAALVSTPTLAADDGMCELIEKLQGVFGTLRTLAFVGAGFILAKYAWEVITTNKIAQKSVMEGAKEVGIAMIFGFVLLFSVGIILSALLNGKIIDCSGFITGQW